MIKQIKDLRIKIFADGADRESMLELAGKPYIRGFTTNPTLMRKSGVVDFERFARDILKHIPQHPISFEVFSDSLAEMEGQARLISSWGSNVYVKIPITNTKDDSTFGVIKKLSGEGIKINVTAIFTPAQVRHIVPAFSPRTPGIISLFAGRVADTGMDPVPIMVEAKKIISKSKKNLELLWASPRELLNIFQADQIGCDIITATTDVLKKLDKVGYDLTAYSLDTVKMFFEDGQQAGYRFGNYIDRFLSETSEIVDRIDRVSIQRMIDILKGIKRDGGRLFILGIGGSAANSSHAVNDFRKICKIEAYAPVDNVAELTAWTNDSSFDVIFKNWLEGSKINSKDGVLVLSVGGGSETTSRNLVLAIEYAKSVGAKTMGIVSRDGGMTRTLADLTILVPVVDDKLITPHAESWQALLWHLIVNALDEQSSIQLMDHDPAANLPGMKRAVFLSRDGTVIQQVHLLSRISQLRLLPGIGNAIKRIRDLGFSVVIVTNQPVVARGIISIERVEAIHQELRQRLEEGGAIVDDIYYCPHHPEATVKKYRRRCQCRKPNSGMLLQASRELNLDLGRSFMIGDGLIDMVAGQRLGLKTILVKTGPGHPRLDKLYTSVVPQFTCQNLNEAASVLEKGALTN